MKQKKSSLLISNFVASVLGSKWDYRLRYFHNRGHFPNLKSPNDMSEILISQMFDDEYCRSIAPFVDKLGVRDYVQRKGLGHILLKHYGVWDDPKDIPFDELPNKFVLKSNNGCGSHVICRDKSQLDKKEAIATLYKAIELGKNNVEPHYHFITPKVYAEELIETEDGSLPIDYKFTCIGGEIADIFVASERAENAKYSTLDLNWNPLPYTKKEFLPASVPLRPKHLEELSKVARILSEDFGFVRVDLYEYRDQPYISELTFFPWGAMLYSYTDDAIKMYGEMWHRSKEE